MLLEMN